eukprot:7991205-Pyramimonas_sp.AAC.1
MEADYHRRGHNETKRSQFYNDLVELCTMVNGKLGECEQWIHHRWDSDLEAPCCRDDDGCITKTVVACTNAMLGKTDPIP